MEATTIRVPGHDVGGGDDEGPKCLLPDDVVSGDSFLHWSQKLPFPTKVAFHADRRLH